jgi:DNA-binding response OmpR family regulator
MSPVLLVDDDVAHAGVFGEYLTSEGFPVGYAHDGEAGARAALSGHYAIAVLDVMLPGMNGIAALKQIRTRSAIPVLMLTRMDGDHERILGLELGADDAVAKSCSPRELAARVRAILRRSRPDPSHGLALTVGQLSIYPAQRRACWDGQPLELTSLEFNLLDVLARNAGRPVSKQELSEQGLGRPLAPLDRNVDVHVSSLRHKLGRMADGRSPLQTVYRLGYQLLRG